jgi:hypothetical protein
MSGFIRVRAVDGPKHEFDAPAGEVRVNAHLYEVLDEVPVSRPRPVKYVKVSGSKGSGNRKPSVGNTKKEH